MPTKPLPKPASKTTLNKKYQFLAIETKGRLDIATEKGRENIDLLQEYYEAFSNLYGAIILSDAWYLFKMAEEDITKKRHIIKKDFYAFSEVARYEDHDYFVLDIMSFMKTKRVMALLHALFLIKSYTAKAMQDLPTIIGLPKSSTSIHYAH